MRPGAQNRVCSGSRRSRPTRSPARWRSRNLIAKNAPIGIQVTKEAALKYIEAGEKAAIDYIPEDQGSRLQQRRHEGRHPVFRGTSLGSIPREIEIPRTHVTAQQNFATRGFDYGKHQEGIRSHRQECPCYRRLRGLGLQIAEALGEQGARVVISSRKAPDLEKAQAHLAGLGIKAEWIAADNSRDEDVKRLADEAIKKLGRVDILVNNAGAAEARRPRITRSRRGTR